MAFQSTSEIFQTAAAAAEHGYWYDEGGNVNHVIVQVTNEILRTGDKGLVPL
mgnify:CR=1 FL=1